MTCRRSLVVGVLAAFLVKVVVPAPALVTHRHAGGEHEHIHPESLAWHHHDDDDHDHDDGDDHHDHPAPASSGPGISPGIDDGRHTHGQLPFQRLASSSYAATFAFHALRRVVLLPPADPPTATLTVVRSRGPPTPARS